jgi:antitoxin component of RelBE/YafQ-DinJ toxin-antitoxin module
VKVAQDKALAFEPLIPNAKTIAAMEESMRGELNHVGIAARTA